MSVSLFRYCSFELVSQVKSTCARASRFNWTDQENGETRSVFYFSVYPRILEDKASVYLSNAAKLSANPRAGFQ